MVARKTLIVLLLLMIAGLGNYLLNRRYVLDQKQNVSQYIHRGDRIEAVESALTKLGFTYTSQGDQPSGYRRLIADSPQPTRWYGCKLVMFLDFDERHRLSRYEMDCEDVAP